VDREYDIFERMPDGSLMWRAYVRGLGNVAETLKQFGMLSPNEHFAIHTPSKEIVARVNRADNDTDGSD
jgi:hypothetical protein